MEYYKFEKILNNEKPIIKVTFISKSIFGNKFTTRDICKCNNVNGFWVFMDNGKLTHNFDPINTFNESNLNSFIINEIN